MKSETCREIVDKLNVIVDNPVDVASLKKRKKQKKLKLSTIARKNPNFQLAAYPKIHKMKLNERLLQILERNDVDRPRAMKEKQEIL